MTNLDGRGDEGGRACMCSMCGGAQGSMQAAWCGAGGAPAWYAGVVRVALRRMPRAGVAVVITAYPRKRLVSTLSAHRARHAF